MPFYKTRSTCPSSPYIARYVPIISCNIEPQPAIFGTACQTQCGLASANTTNILDNNHTKYQSTMKKLTELWCQLEVCILRCHYFFLTCWTSFTQPSRAAWEKREPVLTETFSQAALQLLYIQHWDDIEDFFPCSWLLCEISTFRFKTHTRDNGLHFHLKD